MIPEKTTGFLMYPLYKLYYIDDVDSFDGLSDDEISLFHDDYDLCIRRGIVDALVWVASNPGADLTSVLPGLLHSNKDIHVFVEKVLASLTKHR